MSYSEFSSPAADLAPDISEEELRDVQAFANVVEACPFCGAIGNGLSLNTEGTRGKRCVECDDCGASSGWRETPEEAVEAWEMRTPQNPRGPVREMAAALDA